MRPLDRIQRALSAFIFWYAMGGWLSGNIVSFYAVLGTVAGATFYVMTFFPGRPQRGKE